MLEKEDLDIVEILSPHYLHCEHAVAAAEAKVKSISLQKPMAVTLRECDRIIEACKKNNVILKVYENYIFYPVYQKAKELIQQGLIGDLMSIRIHTMAGLKEGADWPWCWVPGSELLNMKKCQNSPLVGDDGLHKYSLAYWLMEREIEKMSAWIDPTTPLDAPAYVRAKFKNKPGDCPKYGQFDFSFSTKLQIPCEFWLDDFVEIFGEKGVMWIHQCAAAGNREFFKGAGDVMSASPIFPPIVVFVDGKVETFMSDIAPAERIWSTSFVGCTKHFIKVVKEDGEPVYTGERGKELHRYAMAALLSAQENRDVYLDEITTEAQENKKFALKTNFCNL